MAVARLSSPACDTFSRAAGCKPFGAPVPAGHMSQLGRPRIAVRLCVATVSANLPDRCALLEVTPEEVIQDLKLRLLGNRGFNRPQGASCLVFGDVDDSTRLGLLAASRASGGDWLHIFAPAAAVEGVSLRTSEPLPRAAAAPLPIAAPTSSPLPIARPAAPTATLPMAPPAAEAVVHVIVHKSARVAWSRVADDVIELTISSPDYDVTAPGGGGGGADGTGDLMRKVESATGVSLRDGQHRLMHGAQVLDAGRPLAAYGIHRGSVLRLEPVEPPAPDGADGAAAAPGTLPDGSPRLASPTHELHCHWRRAAAGLAEGHAPRLAPAGTGGCYFLRDELGNPVAVFKPADEEPLAANNPKGRAAPPAAAGMRSELSAAAAALAGGDAWALAAPPSPPAVASAAVAAFGGDGAVAVAAHSVPAEGLRAGLRPGEGAVREVAAYILDHGRFAGVPATAMVSLEAGCDAGGGGGGAKVGSLQQYVHAESDCEERGVSDFPASEVHKIAVLDLRLGNTDRNAANILARRRGGDPAGPWELVPIDHGCCLPDKFEDLSFEWQWWPQAELPFDAATLDYIASLDAERDVAALAAHGLAVRPECLRVLRVCTMLLQRAAAAGLTAAQIAAVASRQALDESPLERMHAAAAAEAAMGQEERLDECAYLKRMGRLINEYLASEDRLLDDGDDLLL